MKENIITFLTYYDNFLDMLIGIDTIPDELITMVQSFKDHRKVHTEKQRIEDEANLFIKFIEIQKAKEINIKLT
jgi:hypothetical protein